MQCVDLGGRRIIKKNFFKQKTAYEISECLVGSEMCIRDRACAVLMVVFGMISILWSPLPVVSSGNLNQILFLALSLIHI